MKFTTATDAGLVSCHACGHVQPHTAGHERCGRCNSPMHERHPDSLTRTWALLFAAAILYIPANLLPVMHTASLVGDEDDTIMSGVAYFWTSGDAPLAVIVFIASILVPMLKLSVLALLCITAQRRSTWRPVERTKLYRLVEFIGRWSMLDVFVVTLTVALVRFQSLAVITAGPGAIAFGSVVILTMIASMQFDPRLIWDPVDEDNSHPRNTLRITLMNSPKGPTPPSGGGSLPPDLPEPDIVKPRRWIPSLVWIVPLVAALIGIALVVKSVASRGPTITISFMTAEGLEPGKTKVKYKDVDIGSVRAIKLSPNLSRVLVTVELTKDAEDFAKKDSRFWVVRARVGASGVSGLGTLLSGSYIGADAGRSNETSSDFVGLETPPAVTVDEKGHRYTLHSENLGSLDIGTPIFYRRIQVGQVTGYSLDKDGNGVTVQTFVSAPYDQYVGTNTRWWHASGVNVQLDSSGIKVNTQSLATVIVGGLAFQSPPGQAMGPQAPDNSTFTLADDETDAMKEPDGAPVHVVMYFNQSLRGLSVGAPIDFRGIVLGQVTGIGIEYDPKEHNFTMPVTMNLYPQRLSRRIHGEAPEPHTAQSQELVRRLVARGLRGQLRTGNLITGQLYVALDVFPKAPPAKVDLDRDPMELPTIPNSLEELQLQVADIAKKLDKIPFDQIGSNLNDSLKNANQLFDKVNDEILPQMRGTLDQAQKTFNAAQSTLQQDSPLQSDVHQALQELTRTLQSLNALSDYLERHPESLLRGKSGDKP